MRGGGSALPGLVIERIDARFIERTLSTLPNGVVVISGTNGKTTTTKMVVELLESQGLNVFTNRTGSNFTRGVAAALLGEINIRGQLHADIAVLELDEAHAVHFVRTIKPRYSLLLNVMRDQLDRFGEIDTTAKLLQVTAEATTDTVIINREDPRLRKIGSNLATANVRYYGLSDELLTLFPDDDSMRDLKPKVATAKPKSDVELRKLNDHVALFHIDGKNIELELKLDGVYNIFNAAAALTLARTIIGEKTNSQKLYTCLESITPAFGRGETLQVAGQPLELVLVKNPGGFRLGLSSFDPKNTATMIAINDNYADGRDMSWLWDVEFSSLAEQGVAAVSGVRAYDMALRLQYEEVEISHVDPNLSRCLKTFVATHKNMPKRIYCTYTAMLKLRKELSRVTEVEAVS